MVAGSYSQLKKRNNQINKIQKWSESPLLIRSANTTPINSILLLSDISNFEYHILGSSLPSFCGLMMIFVNMKIYHWYIYTYGTYVSINFNIICIALSSMYNFSKGDGRGQKHRPNRNFVCEPNWNAWLCYARTISAILPIHTFIKYTKWIYLSICIDIRYVQNAIRLVRAFNDPFVNVDYITFDGNKK